MRCPKCHFDHELQTTECFKCGIVFARYLAAQEAASKPPGASAAQTDPREPDLSSTDIGSAEATEHDRRSSASREFSPVGKPGPAVAAAAAAAFPMPAAFSIEDEFAGQKFDPKQELIYRGLALPAALLLARLAVGIGWRTAIRMLTMVLHESGHAITAWLCGIWAVPMLWVTMHGEVRSYWIPLVTIGALGFGGFLAWKAERWGWVAAAGAVLMVNLIFLSRPAWTAGALIVFGGDGGALVLATILMAMFYAGHESALYKSWGVRWGLLVIGAAAFMDVYRTWTGPLEDIPFGELEGVNLSDPSLLTEMYGWPVLKMVDRYRELATACLIALAVIYVWGLIAMYIKKR